MTGPAGCAQQGQTQAIYRYCNCSELLAASGMQKYVALPLQDGGHLQVSLAMGETEWLPWGVNTCFEAAAGRGHLQVLQSARANGCEWDVLTPYGRSAGRIFERVAEELQWAMQNGSRGSSDN